MALDFNAELRREEVLRQTEGIPTSVRRSIWKRVEQSVKRRQGSRRPVHVAFVAGAAAIAIALVVAVGALRQSPQLGQFQVLRESEDFRAHVRSDLLEIERGSATLIDPASGVTLETVGSVALRRESSGVRVVRGRANVTVQHRAPGTSPAVVLVSHGAIEVLGTAFTVVQGSSGGSVMLHEGRIRFRSEGKVLVNLRPGDELAWPLLELRPSAAAPSVSAAAPSQIPAPPPGSASRAQPTPKPAASVVSAEELLDRVEALRSRQQFEAAASELWRGISTQPKPMRERLSFELGSLFMHQIRDTRRACAHWAWHGRTFRGGRYRDEVARSQRTLSCPTGASAP
jgi:transmembrane sensor